MSRSKFETSDARRPTGMSLRLPGRMHVLPYVPALSETRAARSAARSRESAESLRYGESQLKPCARPRVCSSDRDGPAADDTPPDSVRREAQLPSSARP